MSEQYQIKFEYVNPSNIESEVPGLQALREVDLENPTGKNEESPNNAEGQTEDTEYSNFVPVMTVTKEEATFTKGDLKLQKVSVTENISDEENVSPYVTAVNPTYSLVHSKVIQSQPIRTDSGHQDSPERSKEDNDQVEQKKPKTRIPTFKQTVEKVKNEKKDAIDRNDKDKIPPSDKRRSSIPKLSKISKIPTGKNNTKEAPVEKAKPKADLRRIPLPVKDRNVKKHTEIPVPVKDTSVKVDIKKTQIVERENIEESTLPVVEDTETSPNYSNKDIHTEETNDTYITVTTENNAEDEFDKIYDEIFDAEQTEVENYEKMSFGSPISIEDPEKLEMRFEDIIHAYDENEVKPVIAEKSTRPLLKQKSLHDVIMPKEVSRRLSLEGITNDDSPVTQNAMTQIYKEINLENINKRVEEQEIKQHSMLYTNEPAQFETIADSPKKQDYFNSNNDNLVSQNATTQLYEETELGDINNRIKEQEIEQHSMIYTNEPERFEAISHSPEKKDDVMPKYDNLVPQNTRTQVEHEVRGLGDINNRIEEQEIEQHSMMYTNEPAQFETITDSSRKQDYINSNNDNPVSQNETTQVFENTELEVINNRIEEQEIEQHSMIYTNVPAQFDAISHPPEKEDDVMPRYDNLVHQNVTTQVFEEKELGDINNRIEEQEIEQHSMIFTSEPAQFEAISHSPEKEDDVMHKNVNLVPHNTRTQVEYEVRGSGNINNRIEEQEIEQHSMIYTNEPAQFEARSHLPEKDDVMPKYDNLVPQNTRTQVEYEVRELGDINNRIEEQEIEHHSIIYTNEPAEFEIITHLPEEEDIDAQLIEFDNINEPIINVQTKNELIHVNKHPQESIDTVYNSDKNEITAHEAEKLNIVQPNIKETVNMSMPAFNDENINQDKKDLEIEHISEEKYTDEYKPELENQSSTSEVPDSSQMVLNMLSLIRNNSFNKDVPKVDATEQPSEKRASVSEQSDNWGEISTEVNENIIDSNIDKSLQVKDDFIINKFDSKVQNVEVPKTELQKEIPKKTPVKSKIAVFAKDKSASSKEKPDQSAAITSNTASTIKTHRDDTKVKAAGVYKAEHIRKKSSEIDNLKHTENKYQSHSKYKSKNDTSNIYEEPKPSDISNIIDINSQSENIILKDDKITDLEKVPKINEEIPVVRSKVGRIISRLGSQDESKGTQKKEVANEIPKKKSVLSTIAMFEDFKHQATKPVSKPTPDTKLLTSTKDSKETIRKPKIIDQVLKTQTAFENTDVKYDEAKVEIIRNEAIFTAGKPVGKEIDYISGDDNVFEDKLIHGEEQDKLFNTVDEEENIRNDQINKISTQDVEIPTVEVETPGKLESLNIGNEVKNETAKTDYDFKEYKNTRQNKDFSTNTKEMPSIESRLQRMISTNEQSNMRRTKSVAELDLGDAVKGKVLQMIVRINSMENLVDAEKKDLINIKERPRKRSVSEKIALFEKKLTPINMEEQTETKTSDGRMNKNLTSQETLTEEELRVRLADLTNAKIKYGRMDQMICIPLSNGVEMPALAVGTALLHASLIHHIIGAAIDLGYRAIDTAFIYGNEKQVGEAIRAKIDDGTVTREELFIISKLWSTYHRQDLVEQACRASLAAMGLEYFDLYLIHNPMSFKEGGDPVPKIANVLQYSESDYMDAWYGMEGLVSKGLAKSIGVSNFNSTQLAKVHEKGRVKPVVNQVECHPYLSQQRLEQSCGERDVRLSCFGVLGSKGTPGELKGNQSPVIDDPLVKVMAAAMNVSPAQLLVRYQIESGHGVVVKSSTAAHLWDNLQAMAFNITSTELDALNALNRNKRTYTFKGMGDTHRNYPFRTPY